MHQPWQPPMPAQALRLWLGVGLALVLLALVLWSLPMVRTALGPEAATEIEADVCVVAPPTPYNPASGLPLQAARPVPAEVRCPVCGM